MSSSTLSSNSLSSKKMIQNRLQLYRHAFKAMGSLCQLWFYGSEPNDSAFNACQKEAERFEKEYSRYLPHSLIGQLNQGQSILKTTEFDALIHYADVAYQQSEGLFDISAGVFRDIWNFRSGKLPTQSAIDLVLERVGWEQIKNWNEEQSDQSNYSLPAGMQIDLGGIVKEYAADALGAIARENGVTSGLIDLAGDIYVVGPHPNGQPWLVKIRHPRLPKSTLATMKVYQGAVASSGDYERKMVVDGKHYCHIINPKTGWPIEGVSAVSVAADHCIIAGTIATTAMLLGKTRGKEYLVSNEVKHCFYPD